MIKSNKSTNLRISQKHGDDWESGGPVGQFASSWLLCTPPSSYPIK